MEFEKSILKKFLENHAEKLEKEEMKEMKDYERHLMTGALLYAFCANIITDEEEKELDQRYCK